MRSSNVLLHPLTEMGPSVESQVLTLCNCAFHGLNPGGRRGRRVGFLVRSLVPSCVIVLLLLLYRYAPRKQLLSIFEAVELNVLLILIVLKVASLRHRTSPDYDIPRIVYFTPMN